MTVAQLPTTKDIDNMIQNGQVQTSVNGLTIQNGLTTNLVSAKTATGEISLLHTRTRLDKCIFWSKT